MSASSGLAREGVHGEKERSAAHTVLAHCLGTAAAAARVRRQTLQRLAMEGEGQKS